MRTFGAVAPAFEANPYVTPQQYGAVGDGVADDTAAIHAAFDAANSAGGGTVLFPNCTYRIAGTGPDSGGVNAIITTNISVVCGASAKFVADDLDNDIIRISVPSTGTGVPAEGINFTWTGGYFDQSAQKVSTVVPLPVDYPPPAGLTGTSATCDAISIRGEYVLATVPYSGIRRCVVDRVTTYAGAHWQVAGGDSGIFVGGCEEQIIRDCTAIGARDLGVYTSGDDTGVLRCRTTIENNLAVNCFHGFSIKRSADWGRVTGNHAENCVRGFIFDKIAGTGFTGMEISGNTATKCGIFIRLDDATNFSICDNHFTSIGALLSDGTTVETLGGSVGIWVRNDCTRGLVSGNTLDGRTAGLETAYASHTGFFETGATSTNNIFRDNTANSLRILGADNGSANVFWDNIHYNSVTSANLTALGTNSQERRRNTTTKAPIFRQQVAFGDGTVSVPAIARETQANTGMYFATNAVRVSVAGVDKMSITNTATTFNGLTAAVGATFDFASITGGLAPPRMTTAERDAISTPADGVIVYNTSTSVLQVRAGGAWVNLH